MKAYHAPQFGIRLGLWIARSKLQPEFTALEVPEPSTPAASKARKRERLFTEQKGRCYWCGQPMVMLPAVPKRRNRPDNEATIDHLRSRLDPNRTEPANGERRQVLACLKCNNERGSEEQKQLSRDELQRRASNGHRKA